MAKPRTSMRGRFLPKHPEKYIGDTSKIFGRSSWEFKFFTWLDSTPSVLKWSSEEFSIPYLSPIDNKVHKYFPDAFVIYRNARGDIIKEIVEIKPYAQTIMPKNPTDEQRKVVLINEAKWRAASAFASSNGMTFRILTERSIMPRKIERKKPRGTA